MTATIVFVLLLMLPQSGNPLVTGVFHKEKDCRELGYSLTRIFDKYRGDKGELGFDCKQAVLDPPKDLAK